MRWNNPLSTSFFTSPLDHHKSANPITMSGMNLPPGLRPSSGPPQQGGQRGAPSPEEREAAEARARQQDEMKRTMIAAMLEPAARERCK